MNRFRKVALVAIGILVVAITVLVACGPAATPTATRVPATPTPSLVKGGTFRVGVRSNPSTLDPIYSIAAQDGHRGRNVYESLLDWKDGSTIIPSLALSWTTPDPKTFLVSLRQGVKFHDGTDFNAAAVKAHFDRLMDPAAAAPGRAAIAVDLVSVDVVDDYTVRFNLKGPTSYWLQRMADRSSWIPSPTAVQKYGKDFARNPVGTGPFQFDEWVQDSYDAYKRFEGYWEKGVPYVDKVVLKIFPDETARLAALKVGELDMVDAVAVREVAALKGTYNVIASPGWPSYIHVNQGKPPFDNKYVREAISWALDREAIHNSIYFGTGSVGVQSLIPVTHAFFDSSLTPPKRDLEKAKAALAAAGLPGGFKFKINGLNETLQRQVMEVYQAQLADVGIQVEIVPQELVKYASDQRAFNFEALAQPGGYQVEAYSFIWVLLAGAYSETQGYWRMKPAVIPEFEQLLAQAKATYDRGELKRLYNEAERVIAPYYPLIIVHGDATIQALSPKVHGYVMIDGFARSKYVWLEK